MNTILTTIASHVLNAMVQMRRQAVTERVLVCRYLSGGITAHRRCHNKELHLKPLSLFLWRQLKQIFNNNICMLGGR